MNPSVCPPEEQLAAWVELQAEPSTREHLQQHIDDCASCRQVVVALLQTSREVSPTSTEVPPAPLLARGDSVGRYVVLDPVGIGGMGEVYAAYDPKLDRRVALKLLRRDTPAEQQAGAQERLLREAKWMARLSHPNVVAVHDVGTLGDRVFLAMEFLSAQTLAHWLTTQPRSPAEIVHVFIQAGEALAAAHRAGLVHRDFKPSNVLLGAQGEVKVGDFGLAREGTEPLNEHATVPAGMLSLSTRTGTLVGTPAYMAPEQLAGQPATAQSDQFSFCVALYEALFGVRPFQGSTVAQLREALAAGARHAPERTTRVPQRIRRAIEKGLAVEPSQRHPSMESLLQALTPQRSRWSWVAAVFLIATIAGTTWWYAGRAHASCEGGASLMAAVWGPEARAALETAFAKSGRTYAAQTATAVSQLLDAHRDSWLTQYREACVATRVRRDQSEALLDRRMGCLSQRREELRGLVQLLGQADASLVDRSIRAVSGLESPQVCGSAWLAQSPVAPPSAEQQASVESLRVTVATAHALRLAGQYQKGLEALDAVKSQVDAVGYLPLAAEEAIERGNLLRDLSQPAEADQALEEALYAAERAGDRRLTALALLRRASAIAASADKIEHGLMWVRHASAILQSLPADPELQGSYHNIYGVLLRLSGNLKAGLEEHRAALALAEKHFGPHHMSVAYSSGNVGNSLRALGRLEEAASALQRALEVAEGLVGSGHPDLASHLINLSILSLARGELPLAEQQGRRALSLYEETLGPEHRLVGIASQNLGTIALRLHRPEEALDRYQRALKISTAQHGPEHHDSVTRLAAMATALSELGRRAEAKATIRQAISSAEKRAGATGGHPHLPAFYDALGNILLRDPQPASAQEAFSKGLRLREKSLGPEHVENAASLLGWGKALIATEDAQRAIPLLQRALALRTSHPGDPFRTAEVQLALAQALTEGGGSREEARALASAAREVLVQKDPPSVPAAEALLARLKP